jgi:carbonic anhydrase
LYAGGGLGAVIGVSFDRVAGGNEDNYFLDQIIPVYNTAPTVKQLEAQNTYVKSFLNSLDFTNFWSYSGSLTTPPCTEGIKWSVLKEAQPISDR